MIVWAWLVEHIDWIKNIALFSGGALGGYWCGRLERKIDAVTTHDEDEDGHEVH